MLKLDGQPLNVTVFPDKTSQVWKLPESTFQFRKHSIVWEFSNEGEIMHLAQLQDLLTAKIVGLETTLYFKYLPYARQDKLVSNDTTFALKTFLKLLNTMNFHKIIVIDPHNFDSVRVNCQFQAIYPIDDAQLTFDEVKADLVCYPDKGALSKYTNIYNFPYIYGEKVRDQFTGNITSYKVVSSGYDLSGKNVLIIDDICDGGATFKILAKDLLAAGANSVVLFVSHGIFSRGLQTLFDSGIQRIFTQDGEASEDQGQISYRRL